MSDGALTIGEAINLLQEEFPEISVSKVRFLESQGLLRPTRSASGYRQYHQDDLERLRYILELQRDQYLPLKVIKAKLTMWERGEDREGPDRRRQMADGEQPMRIGFEELARRSGLSLDQLGQLVDHGLLDPDEEGLVAEEAIDVAVQAERLFAQGLEARHLRSVGIGADRAIDVIEQLVAPLLRNHSPEGRRRLTETMSEVVDALQRLQAALLDIEAQAILHR
jgi:DNA-binding transcriptional MerR regulator